jgi:hypothetical protein
MLFQIVERESRLIYITLKGRPALFKMVLKEVQANLYYFEKEARIT